MAYLVSIATAFLIIVQFGAGWFSPNVLWGINQPGLFSCADTTGVYRNRAMHCCSSLFHRFPLPISTSPGSHHSPLSIDRILFVHSILSIGHWPQFTWGWRSNRQRDRSTTGLRFWHKKRGLFSPTCLCFYKKFLARDGMGAYLRPSVVF